MNAPDKPSIRIAFAYQHEYRVVDATSVTRSKAGHWLITGRDVDKDEFRTFRVDRIQNALRFVKGPPA
jgi:predicted DNA-binding transcriptional regulator YafY